MIELRNIKKYYDSRLVLEISSLKLKNGIYLVKGANGTGKTTLLKIIAGLLPFEGDILFNEISLKSKPVIYRQAVSWAETEPLYPSFMTGMDLINLYQTVRRVEQNEVNTLLELYSMTYYVNNTISTYSAGMTKKLSIVLAFLGNPEVIILDEPLITLDFHSYNLTCSLIIERNKKMNTNFLMSSHGDLGKELSNFGTDLVVDNKTVLFK